MLAIMCNEGDFHENDVLLCRFGGFMATHHEGQPAVVAHSRMCAALTERQLAWVFAHEEGHLLNGDLETDPSENLLVKECAADAHAKATTGLTRHELVTLFDTIDTVVHKWAVELGLPTEQDPEYVAIAQARIAAY